MSDPPDAPLSCLISDRIPRADVEEIEKILRDLLSMAPALREMYIKKKMHRRLVNGSIRVFGPESNKADESGSILLLNSRQSFVPANPTAPWSKYLGERTYSTEETVTRRTVNSTTIVRFLEERSNCPFRIPKLYIIEVKEKQVSSWAKRYFFKFDFVIS
jgi:hypothetical protein